MDKRSREELEKEVEKAKSAMMARYRKFNRYQQALSGLTQLLAELQCKSGSVEFSLENPGLVIDRQNISSESAPDRPFAVTERECTFGEAEAFSLELAVEVTLLLRKLAKKHKRRLTKEYDALMLELVGKETRTARKPRKVTLRERTQRHAEEADE